MSHQLISFIKSGIRVLGYAMLLHSHPAVAVVLIFSEAWGVVEEIGER